MKINYEKRFKNMGIIIDELLDKFPFSGNYVFVLRTFEFSIGDQKYCVTFYKKDIIVSKNYNYILYSVAYTDYKYINKVLNFVSGIVGKDVVNCENWRSLALLEY